LQFNQPITSDRLFLAALQLKPLQSNYIQQRAQLSQQTLSHPCIHYWKKVIFVRKLLSAATNGRRIGCIEKKSRNRTIVAGALDDDKSKGQAQTSTFNKHSIKKGKTKSIV